MQHRLALVTLALLCAFAAPAHAAAVGDPDVAALQVELRARGLYSGTIDGFDGPLTRAGMRTLQGHEPFVRRELGSRLLGPGASGWDVSELQFLLAWHGFPSGVFDGAFGDRVEAAVLRFQAWAGLPQTGQAGPLTVAALRRPLASSPLRLSWPLPLPYTDGFGPRGNKFHPGLDIPAPAGTPVGAAGPGVVTWADWFGGYGRLVVVDHGGGVRSFYAHLQEIDVAVGDRVLTGTRVGLVGATGEATGPHLHFELRVRGAAIDPLTALT
jgi:hypothetical protein